ncbi:putative thiopurine S-methyltransferase [Dermacentor variabilis]|uniref:putative thiopurine S-methyltransferase n=1 Tax=Dermacentor variabilis TaxID=34621 RepID=UPI003F5B9B88
MEKDAIKPHGLLRDNASAVLDGKREGTVFLPMCGNATELKWFYDQGFRVVGVEFLETVVRSFFAANDLTALEGRSAVNGCKILHTPDSMLSIYICDLYSFSKDCEGTMDIVWDRGGLVSVKEDDRDRYVALLKSLLARDFSYALYATEYEDTGFQEDEDRLDSEHKLASQTFFQLLEWKAALVAAEDTRKDKVILLQA